MTYGELAEIRQIGRRAAVRLAQRHRLRRQPGNDGATRVLVPSTLATLPSHRPTASPVDDAGVNGAVAEANRRADEAHKRADTALALVDKTLAQLTEERARADALRERLEFELGMARGAVQQAQDAAEQLRQAEAARKARRLLARLRAAVRGE